MFVIIVGVFVFSMLSRGFGLRRFGCDVLNEDYEVEVDPFEKGPKFGASVEAMSITNEEYVDLLEVWRRSMREVHEASVFNDLYNVALLNQDAANKSQNESFKDFFKSYIPKYNKGIPRRDNLGLLLDVYERVISTDKWSKVKDHFYFGASDVDVPKERISMIQKPIILKQELPRLFNRPHVVGVIKLDLRNKKCVLIIDMEYNILSNIIDEFDQDKMYFRDVVSFGVKLRYKFLGPKSTYIQVTHHPLEKESELKVLSRDIIFIDRPLCSFIQFTNKSIWSSPLRSMLKLTPNGEPKAFIFVEMFAWSQRRFGKPYCIGSTSDSGMLEWKTFGSLKQLEEKDLRLFSNVCQQLGLDMNEVKKSLEEAKRFMNKYRTNFIKEDASVTPVLRWMEQYVTPTKMELLTLFKTRASTEGEKALKTTLRKALGTVS